MEGVTEISAVLFRNIAIAISLLLLATYAVSRIVFPKMFTAVYDFSKFLNFKLKDEFGSNLRLLSTESFYFTVILSASLSFVALILVFGLSQMGQLALFSWLVPESFGAGILIWLGMTASFQLLFLIKYLFIFLMGTLFNLPASTSRHFQEVQSLNNCFVLAMTSLCAIVVYSNFVIPDLLIKAIVGVTLIYLLYRLLNIYMKLEQLKLYSKLYIFSYLCSTEIIPAIVGIKLLS
ncbi:DUF4271 domain-containing protein [Fabibacter sp. E12]|nr:DUF4271 domain-containing protein [Roseivirga sp. E12]